MKYTNKVRNTLRRPLAFVALLLLMSASAMPAAHAATSGGNGLRVSPVRSDHTINPGTSKTVDVTVTNVTSAPATLQMVVNDFTASADESGNPAIILDANKFASSHSLKKYIRASNNFSLPPGQSKVVPVIIDIPKDAAAGGYYGAVRFAPATSTTGPNQQVNLAGSVGSLILVKVPGDITEKLSVASFDVRRKDSPSSFFTTNKDLAATLRVQNQGNIQVAPFGKVLVKNRSGKVVATSEVNNTQPQGNVLPDSIRKFSVPIKKVGSFGQYKVEGNFGYGSNGQLLSASTTIYVIPKWAIIVFILIVLLLVFIIFGLPRIIRSYNRWVLRKAGQAMGRAKRKY